jgi:hypothetical protein
MGLSLQAPDGELPDAGRINALLIDLELLEAESHFAAPEKRGESRK